jgi:hypothetical protein
LILKKGVRYSRGASVPDDIRYGGFGPDTAGKQDPHQGIFYPGYSAALLFFDFGFRMNFAFS